MNESIRTAGRPAVAPRRPRRVAFAAALAVWLPALCGALSLAQAARWRADLTLYNHCLAVNPRSVMANHNAGYYLADHGMLREACGYYLEALRTDPSHPETHYSLSVALGALGYRRQADRHLREALRLRPDWAAWLRPMPGGPIEPTETGRSTPRPPPPPLPVGNGATRSDGNSTTPPGRLPAAPPERSPGG